MEIKILGTGCAKCKSLEKITRQAVADMGLDAQVSKEEDIMKIMAYGVLQTPGLVINDKVVMSGRLPSASEIESIINQNS